MSPLALRQALGLDQAAWAAALGITRPTAQRWEDGRTEPVGLAAEVLRGLEAALDAGADPKAVGRLVALGVGALVLRGIAFREP